MSARHPHHLIPANALERIAHAARELGWDISYCTEGEGDESEVVGMVMGRSYYVAEMMGEQCETCDPEDDSEKEMGH